jgi:hypothetical protein
MTLKSRPDLVDLRTLSARWRVRRDEEGLPVIPGRRGNVSAQDLTTLCVYITGRTLPALLRSLPPGWRRHQIGDQEANLLAPIADLDRAAEAVRAYRRRKLSPEDIAAKTERLRKARAAREAGHFGGKSGDFVPGPVSLGPV